MARAQEHAHPADARPFTGSTRVYYSNVPFTTTEATLMDVFGAMGTVAELKLFPDPKTGGFRGMGTCTYATPQEAQTAIKALRDFDVDGRPMWCAEDTDKGD